MSFDFARFIRTITVAPLFASYFSKMLDHCKISHKIPICLPKVVWRWEDQKTSQVGRWDGHLQVNAYHKVFTSVKVGQIVGVDIEDESLVVKIVFVSVHHLDNSRADGQATNNALPVGLEGFHCATEDLGIRPGKEVSALGFRGPGEGSQFGGILLGCRLENRSRQEGGCPPLCRETGGSSSRKHDSN